MFKEFKEFALKGNVIDLAIGVIIGAAFNRIVTSFVNDVIMPPFGLILGKVNFVDRFITLSGQTYTKLVDAKANGAVTINYGVFLNEIVSFLIVAFVLFLVVRQINRFKRQPPPPETNTKDCPYCYSKISAKATRCPQCTSQL